ncbi:MAG: M15 family metallopeptidase [Treponema sp.]|nr:M15 family metallopeptidase [Treponema sp.]
MTSSCRKLGFFVPLFFLFAFSCSKSAPRPQAAAAVGTSVEDGSGVPEADPDQGAVFDGFLGDLLDEAGIPPDLARRVDAAAAEGPAFILDLLTCLGGDPFLWVLADKTHPLPEGYAPEDLVDLSGGSYEVNRRGHRLRQAAADSLEEMAAAARADGVTLIVSSAYRSYEYQVEVYARNVTEMGREAADRESARPGYSQHQLGLVADFGAEDGSIGDHFAQTPAGRWMAANAGGFGWSLSFPQDMEAVTGYRWESWHYRYVGRDLSAFIDAYFDGIQQYALQFIHAWVSRSGE